MKAFRVFFELISLQFFFDDSCVQSPPSVGRPNWTSRRQGTPYCPTATLSCLNSCSKDNADNVWLSCRMRRLCRMPKFLLKYRPITRLQQLVQLPMSAVNETLPAFARQQTRRMPLQRSIDGTDGRTPNRYIDPAPRTMRPVRVATFALSQSGTENFWNSICDLVHFEAIWWQLFVGRQTRYICNFAIKIEPNSDPTV